MSINKEYHEIPSGLFVSVKGTVIEQLKLHVVFENKISGNIKMMAGGRKVQVYIQCIEMLFEILQMGNLNEICVFGKCDQFLTRFLY